MSGEWFDRRHVSNRARLRLTIFRREAHLVENVFSGHHKAIFGEVCRLGLEGMMAKCLTQTLLDQP